MDQREATRARGPSGPTQPDAQPVAMGEDSAYRPAQPVRCAARLEIVALPSLPVVSPGDDLVTLIEDGLARAEMALADGDVVVVTSKIVSRSEGRFVDLATVAPSERALALGSEIGKDPRVVELILRESSGISRSTRGALVVRHKLGFIVANAGIDQSNAAPRTAEQGSGPWVLLLPEAPDASAERIRAALAARSGAAIGVVISDSFGRPFRLGTVGAAIGLAGLPALWDRRGEKDLFGRALEQTITALGDQIAAAADLVAGQADEGRAVVIVRGMSFPSGAHAASELLRPAAEDLYA